jgi:L,D-peptidoglycan transpeptidase YkuD (ErfK/YbiS/YcfS/YnhG family)
MIRALRVTPTGRSTGVLSWDDGDEHRSLACALGRGGVALDKREGDGATPVGRFALRRVLYRPDRVSAPATALAVAASDPADGWCDDPADPAYNRPVRLPYPARHEVMWREDGLYDVVVVLSHNDDPVVSGRGSAVFLHCRRPDGAPTAGCVAIDRAALLALLERCDSETVLVVDPA